MSESNYEMKGDGPPSGSVHTKEADVFAENTSSPIKLPSIGKSDKNTDSAKIIEVIPDDI